MFFVQFNSTYTASRRNFNFIVQGVHSSINIHLKKRYSTIPVQCKACISTRDSKWAPSHGPCPIVAVARGNAKGNIRNQSIRSKRQENMLIENTLIYLHGGVSLILCVYSFLGNFDNLQSRLLLILRSDFTFFQR